jgi:hypothetical protein
MNIQNQTHYTVFNHATCIASGALSHIADIVRDVMNRDHLAQILAFDDVTGIQTELNWQHVEATAQAATEVMSTNADQPRKVGRPKLGVVAREVTLLPRHWEWLSQQSGGASVALRKLVEEARHANEYKDRIRAAQEATYRVMGAIAGNEIGFEEALRALYAQNHEAFERIISTWPLDISAYLRKLSANVFIKQNKIG